MTEAYGRKSKGSEKMNQNSYVNAAVRKIQCSDKKKKEIKQQLLQDVKKGMEHGKSIHEVIGDLGTPEQIAEMWNKKVSEEEKKKFKKQRRMKIVGIVLGVLVCAGLLIYFFVPKSYPIETHGIYTEEQVEKKVKDTITMLDNGEYQKLYDCGTKGMRRVLNKKMLEAAKHEVGDNWGQRKSFGKIYMAETKQKGNLYAVAQTTVEYENVSVTYTVSFDSDLKLAGLYMR